MTVDCTPIAPMQFRAQLRAQSTPLFAHVQCSRILLCDREIHCADELGAGLRYNKLYGGGDPEHRPDTTAPASNTQKATRGPGKKTEPESGPVSGVESGAESREGTLIRIESEAGSGFSTRCLALLFVVVSKFIKKLLDLRDKLGDSNTSMPAEPIGFSGNLMLNSGGFFCDCNLLNKEEQGG